MRLALQRNPRIHAARARAMAAAEVPRIDGALPDPRLMLGWYATSVETRVGPQEFSIGISQTIPFPSKLSAKREIASTLAVRARIAYERTVRDVLVEVVRATHELAYIDEAIEITARLAPLLERYVARAAQASPARDLFRAETQRAELENDRVVLEELRVVEQQRLSSLLDLPTGTRFLPRPGATPPVTADFAQLLAIAERHNQELKEAGLARQVAALRTTLARRQRLPDLTIGYTRILTGNLITNPIGNGEDADIIHFGLTLPLWPSKNSARERQAKAAERAAIRDQQARRLDLRVSVARAWQRVGSARRLIRLYRDVLVPRAEQAARTAEDLMTSGKGTLAGSVETIAIMHNFRLAHARARADYGQAVADLEATLGRPLETERKKQ